MAAVSAERYRKCCTMGSDPRGLTPNGFCGLGSSRPTTQGPPPNSPTHHCLSPPQPAQAATHCRSRSPTRAPWRPPRSSARAGGRRTGRARRLRSGCRRRCRRRRRTGSGGCCAMVAADRRRARTMPLRSPLTSVTPALSIATSVPVPMAMPTSAAASAGASLTPSPAMATTRPSRRRRSTIAPLVLGQHLGLDLGDAELRGHGLGGGGVVAGQHDHADAGLLQAASAPGVVALIGIGDGDHAGGLPVDGDEDRGGAVLAQAVRLGASAGPHRWPCRCRPPPGCGGCR